MSACIQKLLRVNLSNGHTCQETIPQEIVKNFIGCRGFGALYLYRELGRKVDPLSPENKLMLATGPLSGTNAQSFSRWLVYTKSPLTGTVMRAVGGGDFGAWMKWAGLNFIIVEGKADKPAYLYIDNDGCKIMDASELWGKDTMATQESLRQIHGNHVRAACIGPAGENLVLYSAIVSGERTASRGGVGTVMGSKNLKAIAINVPRKIEVYNPEAFEQAVREQILSYQKDSKRYEAFRRYGTGSATKSNERGYYPSRNARYGVVDGWEKLSREQFDALTQKHTGCYSCALHCGKVRKVSSGPYSGTISEGPEYETIWAFTGTIDSNDIGATIAANRLCDELGLDTLSTGSTIGFAFELFEKGLIDRSDTEGLELRWGNHTVLLPLIKKIAKREGLGDLLAQGVKRMSEHIGKGTADYAIHVKGLEIPAYDPRPLKAQGFGYATASMGAQHNLSYAVQEIFKYPFPRVVDPLVETGKADIVKYNQDLRAFVDAALVCVFTMDMEFNNLQIVGRLLATATGITEYREPDYLMKVGERICNIERAFNVREGFSRKDDTLPKRILTEPLQKGPAEGQMVTHLEDFLDEYYDFRGWTRTGVPTPEKLAELGLRDIIKVNELQ